MSSNTIDDFPDTEESPVDEAELSEEGEDSEAKFDINPRLLEILEPFDPPFLDVVAYTQAEVPEDTPLFKRANNKKTVLSETTFTGTTRVISWWGIQDDSLLIRKHLEDPFTVDDLLVTKARIRFSTIPFPVRIQSNHAKYMGANELVRDVMRPRGFDPLVLQNLDPKFTIYRPTQQFPHSRGVQGLVAHIVMEKFGPNANLSLLCKLYPSLNLDYLADALMAGMSRDFVNLWLQSSDYEAEDQIKFYENANRLLINIAGYKMQMPKNVMDTFTRVVAPFPMYKYNNTRQARFIPHYTALPYIFAMYENFFDFDNLSLRVPPERIFYIEYFDEFMEDLDAWTNNALEQAVRAGDLTYEECMEFWRKELRDPFEAAFAHLVDMYISGRRILGREEQLEFSEPRFPDVSGFADKIARIKQRS